MAEARANDDSPVWEDNQVEGRYANCFKIGYNVFEFLIDCGQMSSECGSVRLTCRVATNPRSAKELCRTLQHSLSEYERAFGEMPGERED